MKSNLTNPEATNCVILLLILILASTAHAGLNHATLNSAIAVYYFEDLEDFTVRDADLVLSNGVSLTKAGIYGKGLQITNQGLSITNPAFTPASIGDEFSITARVKMPKQKKAFLNFAYNVADVDFTLIGTVGMTITPAGNLRGLRANYARDGTRTNYTQLESTEPNLTDNEWHHIAFTKYGHTYAIFIDGTLMGSLHSRVYYKAQASFPLLLIGASGVIQGKAIVDNLGFFETGFSPFEVNAIYRMGLYEFLNVMPVDPQGKVATTWGDIKTRR